MIIKYFVGGIPHYIIIPDKIPKPTTEESDRSAGRRDRACGLYNEGYRNNRPDCGKAYDEGQREGERCSKRARITVTVDVW